jgi:hypothetical protein
MELWFIAVLIISVVFIVGEAVARSKGRTFGEWINAFFKGGNKELLPTIHIDPSRQFKAKKRSIGFEEKITAIVDSDLDPNTKIQNKLLKYGNEGENVVPFIAKSDDMPRILNLFDFAKGKTPIFDFEEDEYRMAKNDAIFHATRSQSLQANIDSFAKEDTQRWEKGRDLARVGKSAANGYGFSNPFWNNNRNRRLGGYGGGSEGGEGGETGME